MANEYQTRASLKIHHPQRLGYSVLELKPHYATHTVDGWLEIKVDGLSINIDFPDICKMLQVFHGECESLADGKGVEMDGVMMTLKHIVEPGQGYPITLKDMHTGESSVFVIKSHEALGIIYAIEGSLPLICFGKPIVIA